MSPVDIPMLTPSLPGFLSLIITVALPYLVAWLTKRSWSPVLKGSLLIALSFVKAIIEMWIDAANTGAAFNWWTVLYSALIAWVIAQVAYMTVIKNTALRERLVSTGVHD